MPRENRFTKSTNNLERAPIDEPIRCGYDWDIDQRTAPMADPKNTEAQNEELDLDQLKDAAGGQTAIEYGLISSVQGRKKENKFMTNTFLKDSDKQDSLGYDPAASGSG